MNTESIFPEGNYARNEFDVLRKEHPDDLLLPFEDHIVALCSAFYKSGQSGFSFSVVAPAIAEVVGKLLLRQPLTELYDNGDEWIYAPEMQERDKSVYFHKRCTGLFKEVKHYVGGDESEFYYVDAIVWVTDEDDAYSGFVYYDNISFRQIHSAQKVSMPFTPKTFYVEVINIPVQESWAKEKGISYKKNDDGSCYYTILNEPGILREVQEYFGSAQQ